MECSQPNKVANAKNEAATNLIHLFFVEIMKVYAIARIRVFAHRKWPFKQISLTITKISDRLAIAQSSERRKCGRKRAEYFIFFLYWTQKQFNISRRSSRLSSDIFTKFEWLLAGSTFYVNIFIFCRYSTKWTQNRISYIKNYGFDCNFQRKIQNFVSSFLKKVLLMKWE